MATLGEYSSLLQLGVGLGIGLSLFRAPVDLRVSKLTERMDDEMTVLQHVGTSAAKERIAILSSIRLDFAKEKIKAEETLAYFLAASLAGAGANWFALIWASRDAGAALSVWGELGLITLSVLYYLAILAILELLARRRFADVNRRLSEFASSPSRRLAVGSAARLLFPIGRVSPGMNFEECGP